MLKNGKKQEYNAPMVELFKVRVEKGFAGSSKLGSPVGAPLSNGGDYDGSAIFS